MDYTIKQRGGAFFGVIFFLIFSIGVSFLGYQELFLYFTYPETIVFSIWALFAACFIFFFFPFLLMMFPVVLYGREVTIRAGKSLLAIALSLLLIVILGMFVLSFYYKQSLIDKKYLPCKGIPTGWMPGMATKYAINTNLCHKK